MLAMLGLRFLYHDRWRSEVWMVRESADTFVYIISVANAGEYATDVQMMRAWIDQSTDSIL